MRCKNGGREVAQRKRVRVTMVNDQEIDSSLCPFCFDHVYNSLANCMS